MSAENLCPDCEKQLDWNSGLYQCGDCKTSWSKIAFCPVCDAELEKLQACGAVSYFCHQCNETKSKSTVRIEFRANSE